MKRLVPLLVIILSLIMSACSSEPLADVYLASGDATQFDDPKLIKTTTFRADDDLNVIVTLNAHTRTYSLYALFTGPDGSSYATDPIEADNTAGKVLLGLDWEPQNTITWPTGEWRVDIFVDEKQEATLEFDVTAIEPAG
jgi:hypothetical protein